MIGTPSPDSASTSASRAAASLSADPLSSSHNGGGAGLMGGSKKGGSGGAAVWKKPAEGEKEKAPAVMGASSWPALSNSSKKMPNQQERFKKSEAEAAVAPDTSSLSDVVSKTPNNVSNDIDEDSPINKSSGKNISAQSSEQQPTVYIDSVYPTSTTAATSNPLPNPDHRKIGGVGPRSGPPRPPRPYHQPWPHNSYHRYPPHQRGKETFNSDSSNNTHVGGNNNHFSNSKRNQNRFHDFGSSRPKPFHAPFVPSHQGLPNGPHQFLMPRPPPPPPYTPINFSYYSPPLPPPGYMIPYNYINEHPHSPDSSWQFVSPFVDMRGVPPTNLHTPSISQTPTPAFGHQPQLSSINTQPAPANSHSHHSVSIVAPSRPELCRSIRSQIEYYFSDDNLVKDTYLRRQMDDEGWVSVHLIAGFKRVKAMTEDISLILEALEPSSSVEVQGNQMRRRRQTGADGSVGSSFPNLNMFVTQMGNLELGARPEVVSAVAQVELLSRPASNELGKEKPPSQ